jgi:hypothetical protein
MKLLLSLVDRYGDSLEASLHFGDVLAEDLRIMV